MKKIKLSQWAIANNVCYKTAWNYYKEGRFGDNAETNEKGSIFIWDDSVDEEEREESELQSLTNAIKSLTSAILNK